MNKCILTKMPYEGIEGSFGRTSVVVDQCFPGGVALCLCEGLVGKGEGDGFKNGVTWF